MKTISKIKLRKTVEINTRSPADGIDSLYNFSVGLSDSNVSSRDQSVILTTNYDNSSEYLSTFFLDPSDAIALGTALIDRGKDALNDAFITRNIDKMVSILRNNISKGYVETLVVKYHKGTSAKYIDNEFVHIYNIYPIYKNGIKNNHFNFNMPLSITDFTTNNGEDISEDDIKDIIKYRINSLFNNEATYSCLSEEDNEKINNLRSFKIKLVGFRKIIDKDYEVSKKRNYTNKIRYKENKERLLANAQDRAERSAEISRIISNAPKRADGTIDFNKAMELLGSHKK